VQFDRFQRDLFAKIFFAGQASLPPTKLFITSTWCPDCTTIPTEIWARLSLFIEGGRSIFKKKKTLLNLLPSQSSALATFMSSQNIHVLSTDKNLGPAVIECALYQAVARNIFF
jgi:hypothetical protein